MDTLFKLIKTLQKGEKRFFHLYARRHVKGSNNNILLFDAIAKQKVYDEKALKQRFKGTTIAKHFAFNKQYLYKLVLKTLHHYSAHTSAIEVIKEQTHYIKILFDRRLLDACDKLIDKTMVLAEKYEAHHELLRLWEWKMEMTTVRLFRGYEEKDILNIEAGMKRTLAELTDYLTIYLQQRNLYFHSETRGQAAVREEKEKYLKMTKEMKRNRKEGFRSNLFKLYFLELVNRNLAGDIKKTDENIKKIISLVDKHPHIIKDHPREYLVTVVNSGIYKLFVKEYDKAQEIADQVRNFSENTRHSPGLMQASLDFHAILQLSIYSGTLRYEEAESYFSEFKRKQKKFEGIEPNYPRLKIIYYMMSSISFDTGHYKSAIGYLSNLTSAKSTNERTDIDIYARIMQLLSFFVTGRTLALETLARTVKRSLSKNQGLFRIEKLILDFVGKNNKHINDRTWMKEQYSALLEELKKIEETGTKEEKSFFGYINIIKWANHQLEK